MTLFDREFWRDVIAPRAFNNAWQVMGPLLLLLSSGHIAGLTLLGGLAGTGLAAGASVVKTIAGAFVDDTAPTWQQIVERAGGSAAGAVAALLPLDWAGAVHADWAAIGTTALGAALLSVGAWYFGPGQGLLLLSVGRVYGLLPTTVDARDFRARPPRAYNGTFVDLSGRFPEGPYDQGNLGSCVSNGVAAVVDFVRAALGLGPLLRPSRLFLYWNGRKQAGYPIRKDSGLQIRDGFESLRKFGAPVETDWPYDVTRFADQPPAAAYSDGLHDVALVYGQVDPADVDHVIAAGHPVTFGFTVYASFESGDVARTGVMPVPDRTREKTLGGHCVVAVSTPRDGKDIPGGTPGVSYRFCRNSWGRNWGLAGYFWMPMPVFDTDASDFWQLTTVGDPAAPQPGPAPDPGPVAPFPGLLVAAVQAAADDPAVAQFLSVPRRGPVRAAAERLHAILSAPRKP